MTLLLPELGASKTKRTYFLSFAGLSALAMVAGCGAVSGRPLTGNDGASVENDGASVANDASPDGGSPDAGAGGSDAGTSDSGGSVTDAQTTPDTAPPVDSGAPDLGAPACDDAATCTPGTPRLLAPHSTGLVTSRQPRLRWTAADRATAYVVELCSDAACNSVLETIDATSTSAQPTVALPQRRTVFWRVRAVNGRFSTNSLTWQFWVGGRSAPRDTSWIGAPDFDRDGRPDVALGSAANQAYLMMNSASGLPAAAPTQTLTGTAGFGRAMAYAGDVNGDGFGDLVVGAPYSGSKAYLYLGNANGVAAAPQALLSGANEYGYSVAGVGDVNGDGYADVAVSERDTSGIAYLYMGSATGLATTAAATLNGAPVAAAGDVNGDGYADVLVCNRMSQSATLYHGSAEGLSAATVLTTPTGEAGFGETCITAGDVNGDGFAEVVVATMSTAKAYVFYGSTSGVLQTGPSALTGASGGGFGVITSIAPAGDVNGDGYADVIVGGYNGNRVFVYHGAAGGISTTAAATFAYTAGGYANSVATAGDANGDGYADIVFGPSQCSGYDVFVYPGSGTGVTTTTPLRTWSTPTGSQCFGIIAR